MSGYILVIVESPAKTKKIGAYLQQLFPDKHFKVSASMGHIRDLPPKEVGVDVEHGFKPNYVISRNKGKVVATLRKQIKDASALYLAADPDREGEAIAWHLVKTLKPTCPIHRVTFNAITLDAIKSAFAAPRQIDMDLVKAQEVRRIIDRLVGYTVSPLLWKVIEGKGTSAGRVQSVALRLTVERHREIQSFKPKEFFTIQAQFQADDDLFSAKLYAWKGTRWSNDMFSTEAEAQVLVDALQDVDFVISDIERKPSIKRPPAPFTTSTLQQVAAKHLDISPAETMKLAQKLYEDGKITYIRTDSPAVSPEAQTSARKQIKSLFSEDYLPAKSPVYKSKGGAQEAHECIRPTHIELSRIDTDNDPMKRLYQLIWQRFVASQMASARYDRTTVIIRGGDAVFRVSSKLLNFAGFLKLYDYAVDDDQDQSDDSETAGSLPQQLDEGQQLTLINLSGNQQFTKAPAFFNQASLIKTLEQNGVGRPSTFASMVSTILDKGYVTLDKKKLVPTDAGYQIIDFLLRYFPDFFAVGFTANMEDQLDQLASGSGSSHRMLVNFWDIFEPLVSQASQDAPPVKPDAEETDIQCPICGQMLLIRTGKNGQFYSCSSFPSCRYSRSMDMPRPEIIADCPDCDTGKLVLKKSKKGKVFVACLNFPDCKYSRNLTEEEKERV